MSTRRDFLARVAATTSALSVDSGRGAEDPHQPKASGRNSFGLIGGGWRGQFYLRIASELPDRFPLVGVVERDAKKRELLRAKWGAPVYASAVEMLAAQKPTFVVACVSPEATETLLESMGAHNMPVLTETPIGRTLPELRRVAARAKAGARIQVAEQYHFQPMHMSRLKLVRDGKLGTVHEADISCAHGYHGVSLLRNYLRIGLELPKVSARRFTAAVIAGPNRQGPPTALAVVGTERVIAQFDWGDRLGIFDFDSQQYFSWVRSSRVLVRGTAGEIKDDHVRILEDFRTPLEFPLVRQDTGHEGNLEGYYLRSISGDGAPLYRNSFAPARLTDDEIACATALERMQDYVDSNTAFYGVPEACQDRYLDLLIAEAVNSGKAVQAMPQPWME